MARAKPKQQYDERGRPTIMTDDIVQKLEQSLQNGFTVEKAVDLAGVGKTSYYNWLKQDEIFSERMEKAKGWAVERARQVVVTAIQGGDVGTSRWLLERKASDEFGNKNRIEGVIKQENTFSSTSEEEILAMQAKLAEALGNIPANTPDDINVPEEPTESAENHDVISKQDES